ncbi:hypothetical protein SCHPADRAFT_945907 [Schizopora paradoxa]|uniref:Uncharacterized protein n=1 Tax=Schizopora paradoxa TaxID=27342 RepID=A0A0H2RPC0_9AGAM|nr:hypothetical protein SCHPADRAFT_945907 [Schizopora paradoxa]
MGRGIPIPHATVDLPREVVYAEMSPSVTFTGRGTDDLRCTINVPTEAYPVLSRAWFELPPRVGLHPLDSNVPVYDHLSAISPVQQTRRAPVVTEFDPGAAHAGSEGFEL